MNDNSTDLIKRAEDLSRRCLRSNKVTLTGFLTPAQRAELEAWGNHLKDIKLVFSGGGVYCQRTVAFFLPDYMDEDSLDVSQYISAIHIRSYYGTTAHRDYMGAVLGMGVGREWVGDIQVQGDEAYVFCLQSIADHLSSIDKVGRYSVKADGVELAAVPVIEPETKEIKFSVAGVRLDSVLAGMFKLSRTQAQKEIEAGGVSVNYLQCLKPDYSVKDGDTISLKGRGKGLVVGCAGTSKKGRIFINAKIYI